MNPHDRLKNPFYALLSFQIESLVCKIDEDAKSKQILLSDSQVRSALLRTVKLLRGKAPAIPKENDRDLLLAQFIDTVIEARLEQHMAEEGNEENPQSVPATIWSNACETVAASINNRKSDVPGSRVYLDFIHGFIQNARSS